MGTILQAEFPDIILWHCANHRLDLNVGDTVKEVAGINSFKIFIDSLYSLYYSMSPKLQGEIRRIASDLDVEPCKMGRVLDTRWAVISSLCTIYF